MLDKDPITPQPPNSQDRNKRGNNNNNNSSNSPLKLAPHHDLFMTNLKSSPLRNVDAKHQLSTGPISPGSAANSAPPTTQLASAKSGINTTTTTTAAANANANTNTNANANANIYFNSSSTKVIESLQEQVDTLTNTNLQLTLQSHGLLNKLEDAQEKESKLIEILGSLKDENNKLNNMLQTESERLKDLEKELVDLKEKYGAVVADNGKLKKEFDSFGAIETTLNDEFEMVTAQYNSIVRSQETFKEYYSGKIAGLKDEVESLKQENEAILHDYLNYDNNLIEKLDEFDTEHEQFKSLANLNEQLLTKKFQELVLDTLPNLSLDAWISLYNESKDRLFEFAEKMGYEKPHRDMEEIIEQSKRRHSIANGGSGGERSRADLPQSPGNGFSPIRMPKIRNSGLFSGERIAQHGGMKAPVPTMNSNTFGPRSGSSGNLNGSLNASASANSGSSSSGSGSGNTAVKRTSFYGISSPIVKNTVNFINNGEAGDFLGGSGSGSSGSSGSGLPGVKRTGSLRKSGFYGTGTLGSLKNLHQIVSTPGSGSINRTPSSSRRQKRNGIVFP